MRKNIKALILLVVLFGLNSCSKKEEYVNILQDKYEPAVREAEFTGEDFFVNLNARALQTRERGEWKILSGTLSENNVFFVDKTNPFTKFKGIPGEEYILEWKHWAADGNVSAIQVKVKIPDLVIEIADNTPSQFETIRLLAVNPKYRGTWSVDGTYGYIGSKYHDGYAEPPEKKPSIELHGYANRNYTVTYTYSYAGKIFKFQKTIKTGSYTEDEGLYELQLSRGNTRVIEDNLGNILELNLQASGVAWIFGEINTYPALQAFKKMRKLILGGSSLRQIPTVFGDHYLNLENLDLDGVGENLVFPDNFGNLRKLKTLIVSPRFSANPMSTVVLPTSFANLKELESFTTRSIGLVDFNGTLGGLSSLRTLKTPVVNLPENIGNLKQLEYLEIFSYSTSFPARFSECQSLKFARINFYESAGSTVTLSAKIGDLKKLEFLDITSNKLYELPATFPGLSALKTLRITATNLQSIPEDIGSLANLEEFTLYGSYTKIPNSIGNLSKISYLTLAGKAPVLPESFGNLTSLIYFNGSYSEFKTLPNSIGNLKNLKEILLGKSKIEALPPSFSDLNGLEKLDLSETKLKTFPKEIIPLKSIRDVFLSGTNVGDIPDEISGMKSGVIFSFYQIPNLTLEHLKYILSISKGKVFQTSYGYFSSGN